MLTIGGGYMVGGYGQTIEIDESMFGNKCVHIFSKHLILKEFLNRETKVSKRKNIGSQAMLGFGWGSKVYLMQWWG